jgi:uncharacterized LabA/DUF88 family protein
MNRVIVYIDGFNLYYGLKDSGWRRYYWLNMKSLAENLLKPGQQLTSTKYFTSRVSSCIQDPDKAKRQSTYLEALETLSAFRMFYGHYLQKPVRCRNCGACWNVHEEKMTDVNIAVELITDAFQDCFDTALLISGDSDLAGPIEAVSRLFPAKRVVVAFPPKRHSARLCAVANASFTIGRKRIADSQFPNHVTKPGGHVLRRPGKWT